MSHSPTNEKASAHEREKHDGASSDGGSVRHIDTVGRNENARIANPLAGIPRDQLMANAARFARAHGLEHITAELQKGALVAQDPAAFESLDELTEEDKAVFRKELTHRWHQPWQLYYLVILCSMAAAVQGVGHYLVFFAVVCGPGEGTERAQSGMSSSLCVIDFPADPIDHLLGSMKRLTSPTAVVYRSSTYANVPSRRWTSQSSTAQTSSSPRNSG